MEPDVEEWFEQGQSHAKDANAASQMLSSKDRQELWQWAPGAANGLARKQKWGADYTLAEVQSDVENVVTGLKRELVEPPPDEDDMDEDDFGEEDEDDEDKEGVMEVDADAGAVGSPQAVATAATEKSIPQMPMESVHKFMVTGKVG